MRKVTQAIVDAWSSRSRKTVQNTRTDGTSIWLHDNEIVRRVGSDVEFTLAGWPTVTTRDRLNGVLRDYGIGIYQTRGHQYASVGGYDRVVPLEDDHWYSVDFLRFGDTQTQAPVFEPDIDQWAILEGRA